MTDPAAFTLAVTNRKGGSGKTTTSVNLASELAARGFRVLLVDADSQGHCALGLGVAVPPDTGNVHDLFIESDQRLAGMILPTRQPGLDLVPANTRFDGRVRTQANDRLDQALNEVRSQYDVIIVDTPPSVDALLLNALHAATGVLIPLVPQVLGSAGVRQLSQLFYQVAAQGRPGLKLIGLLPVMCDRKVPSHARVLSDLSLTYGAQRIMRGIRTDVRLAEAFGAGQPIREYAPRSRGAMDYFMLAEGMLPMLQPETTQQQTDRTS